MRPDDLATQPPSAGLAAPNIKGAERLGLQGWPI
jgi:hypothetical protein